jgi:hypothetical protein
MYFKNGPFISEKVVGHTVIKMIFLAGRRFIVNEKILKKIFTISFPLFILNF